MCFFSTFDWPFIKQLLSFDWFSGSLRVISSWWAKAKTFQKTIVAEEVRGKERVAKPQEGLRRRLFNIALDCSAQLLYK